MRTPAFLAIALLFSLLPASAGGCQWTTSEPEVDTLVEPRFYVEYDACQPECMWSMWVYQESNGIDGLQRGDEVKDDTCNRTIQPDTIVF